MSNDIVAKRVEAVRKFCAAEVEYDYRKTSIGMTDRAWCAQSVLNILNGIMDWQLEDE